MARPRLQATMESQARKRQKEYEEQTKWTNQTQYYKNWERRNTRYDNWTSPEYYETSLEQYNKEQSEKEREKNLQVRREKLRKLLFDEDQEYLAEITAKPKGSNRRNQDVPTDVLKEVNIGLKIAEEDKRRHEAELKLYHKWRSENPIIRDYESNQHRSGVKMAWLDQQIEKRMQQEKVEEETKRMIEERNELIKQEEELERKELEENGRKEKEMYAIIEKQIKELKLKESEADVLKDEEYKAQVKKRELEELMARREDDLKRRSRLEMDQFNSRQTKLKLRNKAMEIEENLKFEQSLIEQILSSEVSEQIYDEDKRRQTKEAMLSFLNYVKDQRNLEEKRQRYISFVFDSEAKALWDKQEKLWKDEEDIRRQLLEDVLAELKEQIQEKIDKNLNAQRALLKIREDQLKEIEESEREMREEQRKFEERKVNRMMEFDKQIHDKRLMDKERQMEEEKKQLKELEDIRKEEDKLKNELIQLQRQRYHPARFNRRILW